MKNIPFFKPFTDDELSVLLANSNWLKYNAKDVIFQEGDTDSAFYIILKGSVTVRKKDMGVYIKSIGKLDQGQCFGEMSVITGEPRSADVVADQETYLLKIDVNTLNIESDSIHLKSIQYKFYKIFSATLADRLNKLNREFVKTKWI